MKFEALALSRTGKISLKKPGGRLAALAVHGWLLSTLLACVLVAGNFQLAIIGDSGVFSSLCRLLLNSNGPKVSGSLQTTYS